MGWPRQKADLPGHLDRLLGKFDNFPHSASCSALWYPVKGIIE